MPERHEEASCDFGSIAQRREVVVRGLKPVRKNMGHNWKGFEEVVVRRVDDVLRSLSNGHKPQALSLQARYMGGYNANQQTLRAPELLWIVADVNDFGDSQPILSPSIDRRFIGAHH